MDISSYQSTILQEKTEQAIGGLVLHLKSSGHTPDQPKPTLSSSSTPPILINGTLVANTKKRYRCTYEGCDKAYSKPSRLEEHERSHTGQRPFICETCGKSYLRETHLHAHARSHLPNDMRTYVCKQEGCGKRFWTSQHLQVHHSGHDGSNPYKCQENDCNEAFAKHNQLRAHVCTAHAPPGTKPYRCDFEGCLKSFDTNQHLSSHQKTHDPKRYTCIHPSCNEEQEGSSRQYFPTWSSLQSHIKKAHPPTCPHQSCKGKTFSNPGNLRAHLKLHENCAAETGFKRCKDTGSDDSPPRKRRRGSAFGRDWKCDKDDCIKDFQSENALRVHINVCHLGRRDFACDFGDCKQTFGYKHLLQRHVARSHVSHAEISCTLTLDEFERDQRQEEFDIDMITGNAYAKQAVVKSKVRCPYPELTGLLSVEEIQSLPGSVVDPKQCEFVFSRGYDLRRHFSAFHGLVIHKEVVDTWVRIRKQNSGAP